MNQKRQNINLEMLSAYLDNQLSEKERSKVESTLQVDPALKQELSMLDATRRLLRNAPTLKVPRNFTLTTSMVAKQNPFKFWMPAMSFSSALAAVLFVLSFIFNFSPVGTTLTAQTRNMDQFTASDSVAVESMEMAEESEKSSAEETPMIIQWFGEQANGLGGGGPASSVTEGEIMAEEAAPMAAEAPALEMEAESAMPAMEEAAGAGMDTATGQITAEEPAPAMEEALPAAKDGPDTETDGSVNATDDNASNLILGISPEEDRGQIIEEQHAMPQDYNEEMQNSYQNTTWLAVFRMGLLLLSITFAIIAYLMYRQRA